MLKGMGKREEQVHVVLAGGGTAGHVNPLLSVADAIRAKRPNSSITVIGTETGLERELVPQAGYELETIEKVPFPRSLNAAALAFPSKWFSELRKAKAILKRHQADVVVGFGGYASAPVYRAAKSLHVPIAIHEQNAKAGMANKLGAKWADYIGTVYDHTGLESKGNARSELVGLPLRPSIARLCRGLDTPRLARVEAASSLGIDPTRPLMLVTGGSLGAASINSAVAGASAELLERVQIIHLTGKGKLEEVKRIVSANAGSEVLNDLSLQHLGQGDYHAVEYLERMDLAYACADLTICRAGAGTVAELAAVGMPAIYVPLPFGNGEQRFNAQPLVEAGGGLLVDDADFTKDWVAKNVVGLVQDQHQLQHLAEAAWKFGTRDAAEKMAERVLALADGTSIME
ncbi:MAG: undecaprenyldiphospho-muramoylpentapeptide beta-N-acetylglucosaminyltransferase [Bifidobacterium sp.]|jgi:UDP-N-acetylglucosamine--N-acetylmuramyl-(pentapeptide) pyrophosphoryl-undecaprenol N-acetylglucosamine transferase|nr:undecaprenyldiphospho-muramoylpentapeptide beta-N-acetylglucosaminyltransferase [Bifidobacterium sp.]MCH4174702.1 undecaprenyldiphospho-muramoylpentapeptide beta-N-acetylglucosaminyltransferase [Bifidobacterium sp.]